MYNLQLGNSLLRLSQMDKKKKVKKASIFVTKIRK